MRFDELSPIRQQVIPPSAQCRLHTFANDLPDMSISESASRRTSKFGSMHNDVDHGDRGLPFYRAKCVAQAVNMRSMQSGTGAVGPRTVERLGNRFSYSAHVDLNVVVACVECERLRILPLEMRGTLVVEA